MLQFKNCNILEAISPLILQPHGTVLTENRAVSSLELAMIIRLRNWKQRQL